MRRKPDTDTEITAAIREARAGLKQADRSFERLAQLLRAWARTPAIKPRQRRRTPVHFRG